MALSFVADNQKVLQKNTVFTEVIDKRVIC